MRHPQCTGGKGKAVWQPQYKRMFLYNPIKVLPPTQISSFAAMFRSSYRPGQNSLKASYVLFNPDISKKTLVSQIPTKEN